MIFGSGSPNRAPVGPGALLGQHLLRAAGAWAMRPAEAVKRKSAGAFLGSEPPIVKP